MFSFSPTSSAMLSKKYSFISIFRCPVLWRTSLYIRPLLPYCPCHLVGIQLCFTSSMLFGARSCKLLLEGPNNKIVGFVKQIASVGTTLSCHFRQKEPWKIHTWRNMAVFPIKLEFEFYVILMCHRILLYFFWCFSLWQRWNIWLYKDIAEEWLYEIL